MPDRVVKESIGRSDSLAKVSLLASLFWANFLTVMDDHGCFDARPRIIRSKLFPLRDDVTDEMVESWLQEYANNDVKQVELWTEPDGVRYGRCLSFDLHNDLISRKSPTTPCPPSLKDENSLDPRLATDTLQAFERIRVAVAKLSSSGKTPTYREIIREAGCSNSTLAKYWKHSASRNATPALHLATDATPKNQNLNQKENLNQNKESGESAAVAAKPQSKPKRPLTEAPAEIPITAEMREWAAKKQITADLESETEHMLDHHRAKGTKFKDWGAAWRTWMRNSKNFSTQRGNGNGNTPQDRERRTNQAANRVRDRLLEEIGGDQGRGTR